MTGPHLRRDRAHIRAATAAHICARIRATRHAAARKFPKLRAHNYELAGVPGLFVAGELMHAHDYRAAAGGAIHGYSLSRRGPCRPRDSVRLARTDWAI